VLLPFFEPGTLAIDVGASLGLYTTRLAMRARDIEGQVIAFEPVPSNRGVIEDNLKRNALLGFAEVRAEALGDRTGIVHLQVERGGAGNAAIAEGVDAASYAEHALAGKIDSMATADIRPLDELELPPLRCSVMKLDVEGCELQVLRGAEALIARDRPVIQGEFSRGWLDSRGEDIEWLSEWAHRHGYRFGQFVVGRTAWWREGRIRLQFTPSPIAADMLLLPDGVAGV
jgi:FkbM family methyltransferase